MSFFTNMRADRLIAEIKATGEGDAAETRRTLEKLAKLGPAAIPRVIDALANADRHETAGFVGVLASLLDNKTLPLVVAGLADGNQRTVAAVTAALTAGRGYSPQLLLAMLDDPRVPKAPVVSVLTAQKARLNARDVLQRAYSLDAAE